MSSVYILGGLRSYIGLKNGVYKNVPAESLGAEVLKRLIEKYRLEKIDRIICGNSVGAGGNITRLMSLLAGVDVPALTVDSQCSSGLEAVSVASALIACGSAEAVVCGGFESSSTRPLKQYSPNHPDYALRRKNGDILYGTAKFSPGEHSENIMLSHAEKTAMKYGVTRGEMDVWVLNSHKKAAFARDNGLLGGITCSVFNSKCDEAIRDNINMRLLQRLKPVLPDGKLINAANSCLINDGAAFLILCSEDYLKSRSLKPLAKVIGFSHTAVLPENAPVAALSACEELSDRFRLPIGCYEVNEAFALIDVLMERAAVNMSGYNIFGGALAYGHPYGASGAVILLHLIRALEYTNRKYGICSVAAAGGLGCGALIEKTEG